MKRSTKIVARLRAAPHGRGASAATASDASRPPREAAALTGAATLYRSDGDDITFDFTVVPWQPEL